MNPAPPLRVELGPRSYDIRFHHEAPAAVAADIAGFVPERAMVIAGATPWRIHGKRYGSALRDAGVDFDLAEVPDGEIHKTFSTAGALLGRMIEARHGRRACVIAFGGGVVGDLAGFVAAMYLRGVDCVQVPTTVVAMVDSAVGGKTGVDHPLGKNLVGAFHQPKLVAVDSALLGTLDDHNLRGGFAEVAKYGVIADAAFFEWLERDIERALALDDEAIAHVIRTSCAIKARVVADDERESEGGTRATLNFGHTFAHAIEAAMEYGETQMHGQAVAMGMCCAADLAADLGLCDATVPARIEALLTRAGLPTTLPAEPAASMAAERLYDIMGRDKKARSGRVRFILPRTMGMVEMIADIPPQKVHAAIRRRQRG